MPVGPSHAHTRACTARALRAQAILSKAPPAGPAWAQPKRQLGSRGGGEPRNQGRGDHSPQYAEFSSSSTTRGHISAPSAGSPPPPPPSPPPLPPPQPVSGAAAAVTIRTARRRWSQAEPTAQAAWLRARALPCLHARASRARALVPAPAAVAADAGPPNSRT